MKNIYGFMLLLGVINASFGQLSTGVVTLDGTYTAKVDITSSLVTVTLTGPSDRWFALAFNNDGMNSGDLIAYNGTSVRDLSLVGYTLPSSDTKQDWTIAPNGNTVNGAIRTIIATRALNTGESGDQVFSITDSSIKLGWSRAGSASYTFARHNGDGGFTTALFKSNDLATDDFATLGAIEVLPNPSKNGMFSVSRNNLVSISKINVFDTTAKLLKSMDVSKSNQTENVDLTGMAKGIYFMELSNETNKTVKKIIIE
jgi:Secretion system C-terminal sorting domain